MKTWPGLNSRGNVTKMQPPPVRDGIYYVGASNPMLQPDFWAPMNDFGDGQVAVALAKGVGTPTFNRASIATCRLRSGLLKKVLAGVPRSHYLADGNYAGYLQESPKTNILLQSEALSTAPWSVTGTATLTLNAILAPDGTNTGAFLAETTNLASQYFISQAGGINGTLYNYSIFAKAGTRNWLRLEQGTGGGGAWFNLATGTVGTINGGASASMEAWNNGWYRCSLSRNMDAIQAFYAFAQSQDAQFAYDGTAGNGIYLWGGHAEATVANAYSSSYIPTVAAPVTRAFDDFRYLVVPYNTALGAAYAELSTFWTAQTGNKNALASGGRPFINQNSASTVLNIFDSLNMLSKAGMSDMSTGVRKRASTWGAAGLRITGDGLVPAIGVFDGSMDNAGEFEIGHIGGAEGWDGTLKNIKLWYRELSSDDIRFITGF